MSIRFRDALLGGILAVSAALPAAAEVPRVATDIAPVHGLAARVMEGLGEPQLIVRRGASPHGYSMRPSEARALEQADAVFWVGPELEPWLGDAIRTLAADADAVEMLSAPGTETLAFREGETFEAHGHGEGDEAQSDAHGGATDPHAWLDPENAKAWLGVIAEHLSRLDPGNAAVYEANAEAGRQEIDAVAEEVREMLAPLRDMRFVVFHDAYHYFERAFGLPAVGAISVGDASDPGPARVEAIRDRIVDLGVSCVFSEPEFNDSLVRTVLDGTEGRAGVIDPLGTEIATGPDFYLALLRSIAQEIVDCGA